MDTCQLGQIISGLQDLLRDISGDKYAEVYAQTRHNGPGEEPYIKLQARALRCRSSFTCPDMAIEPYEAMGLIDRWVDSASKNFSPGRCCQIERRVSDLFTDHGPTPTQLGDSDAVTVATIKSRCETALKFARRQHFQSDSLPKINRMAGTIRTCERILGIIERGER